MAVAYLDTSALGRVLLGEPDRPAILRELGAFELRVASRLTRASYGGSRSATTCSPTPTSCCRAWRWCPWTRIC